MGLGFPTFAAVRRSLGIANTPGSTRTNLPSRGSEVLSDGDCNFETEIVLEDIDLHYCGFLSIHNYFLVGVSILQYTN